MKKFIQFLGIGALAAGLAVAGSPASADQSDSDTPRLASGLPTDSPPPGADATRPGAKVVNGQPATVEEYPFIISQHRTGGARPTEQSCTGTVAAKRVVLIAAHCKFSDGDPKYLIYGRDDLSDDSSGARIEIDEYRTHPNYNPNDGWRQGWDVAVIIAAEDIPVPDTMEYPQIAGSGDELPMGAEGTAVGYGMTEPNDSQQNTRLLQTTLPVVEVQNCAL
ncbi:MAG: S1 family peptidase, partial [Stackebrandtia sp.]